MPDSLENARLLGEVQGMMYTLETRVKTLEGEVRRMKRGTDSGSFDLAELKKKDKARADFIRTIVTDLGRVIALAILVWVALKLGVSPQVIGK